LGFNLEYPATPYDLKGTINEKRKLGTDKKAKTKMDLGFIEDQ
jgi:hypothetical protein